MEASAHVNSLAARARILRALPGQLTPAKLADPAASLAAIRALDAFCLTAADAIDAHDAASRADRDAIEDASEALDRFVAHVERACDPRGGGDLASRAAAATLLGRCARDLMWSRGNAAVWGPCGAAGFGYMFLGFGRVRVFRVWVVPYGKILTMKKTRSRGLATGQ